MKEGGTMKTTLLIVAAAVFAAVSSHAGPAVPAKPAGNAGHDQACAQLKDLNAKEKADIAALDEKIKALHEQLKPLEEQKKGMVEQYRSQRDALKDQIAPGAGAALAQFESQLKELGEKEQGEMKALREKYQEQRKGMKPPKLDLRCR
jgi:polyhydroxyalkanoate synthesis regulator phasin